uniref:Uncharacterized protein n=1 Tax=Pipistrellus kuhlii TaxID=59472 RepID=A0A7J8B2K9_PIPKU|nr:hypothetical protein mPipKuh1_007924 [Pipistrellus kuhlii]
MKSASHLSQWLPSINKQVLARTGRKGNGTLVSAGGNAEGAATVEGSMAFPQKVKNGPALRSSHPPSGNTISAETQNMNSREYTHPVFTAALCTIAKVWKQPQCPSEWIKSWGTPTQWGTARP